MSKPDRVELEYDSGVTVRVVNKYLKGWGYKVKYVSYDKWTLMSRYKFLPIKAFYGKPDDSVNRVDVFAFGDYNPYDWKTKLLEVLRAHDEKYGTVWYNNTLSRYTRNMWKGLVKVYYDREGNLCDKVDI